MGDLESVMRTTFAGRTFTDEDVSDDEVAAILDVARFAPSGGNRQGWRVVVVRAATAKTALVDAALPAVRRYVAQQHRGESPFNTITPSAVTDDEVAAVSDEQVGFFRRLADAPLLVVVGVDLRVVASIDAGLGRVGLVSGASVYPFVQNLLLAARNRGLAGTLTTFATWAEPAVQDLLGFPSEVAVAAVVPLGHPTSEPTRLSRNPVGSFARLERWDGEPLRAANDVPQ